MVRITKSTLAARRRRLLKTQHKTKKNPKRVLTIKKRKHSDNPTYLSSTYQEYKIKINDFGLFYIIKHRGGNVPRQLSGHFSNFTQAESALIFFLESTDKVRQSRYPGCPERKENAYTQLYLQNINTTSRIANADV